MLKRTLGCVFVLGWLMAGALQAHHSLAGVYDMKNERELSGTVAQIKFSNPHGSLSLDVQGADGKTTQWVLTLGSATAISFSRITESAHFPSDVWLGASLGYTIARYQTLSPR